MENSRNGNGGRVVAESPVDCGAVVSSGFPVLISISKRGMTRGEGVSFVVVPPISNGGGRSVAGVPVAATVLWGSNILSIIQFPRGGDCPSLSKSSIYLSNVLTDFFKMTEWCWARQPPLFLPRAGWEAPLNRNFIFYLVKQGKPSPPQVRGVVTK